MNSVILFLVYIRIPLTVLNSIWYIYRKNHLLTEMVLRKHYTSWLIMICRTKLTDTCIIEIINVRRKKLPSRSLYFSYFLCKKGVWMLLKRKNIPLKINLLYRYTPSDPRVNKFGVLETLGQRHTERVVKVSASYKLLIFFINH